MTHNEFRTALTMAFNSHTLMNGRNKHTINELLYILRSDDMFRGEDYNISVMKNDGACCCIPSISAFINLATLGVWFDDERVKFEVEEFGEEKFNCITVYEREEN